MKILTYWFLSQMFKNLLFFHVRMTILSWKLGDQTYEVIINIKLACDVSSFHLQLVTWAPFNCLANEQERIVRCWWPSRTFYIHHANGSNEFIHKYLDIGPYGWLFSEFWWSSWRTASYVLSPSFEEMITIISCKESIHSDTYEKNQQNIVFI